MTRLTLLAITVLTSSLLGAIGMEEFMYSSGKINVVIAVILIILCLVFAYLFNLNKKIKELEDGE